MKFKYVVGLRPTPMLMYYSDANEEVYQNHLKEVENRFNFKNLNNYTSENQHYWNHGAYLIIKANVIIDLVVIDFAPLLYLLRAINQPLEFQLSQEQYEAFKKDLEQLKDEIVQI